MKESKFVKTKIVAGYVILIAVCILSVGYVYREVVRFRLPTAPMRSCTPNAAPSIRCSTTSTRPRVADS